MIAELTDPTNISKVSSPLLDIDCLVTQSTGICLYAHSVVYGGDSKVTFRSQNDILSKTSAN